MLPVTTPGAEIVFEGTCNFRELGGYRAADGRHVRRGLLYRGCSLDTLQSPADRLNSIDKVKSFVNAITQYEYDFDLISGRYVIDAKSIMGIFSLDLSKPIDLAIHAENNMDEIMETLKPYLI